MDNAGERRSIGEATLVDRCDRATPLTSPDPLAHPRATGAEAPALDRPRTRRAGNPGDQWAVLQRLAMPDVADARPDVARAALRKAEALRAGPAQPTPAQPAARDERASSWLGRLKGVLRPKQ